VGQRFHLLTATSSANPTPNYLLSRVVFLNWYISNVESWDTQSSDKTSSVSVSWFEGEFTKKNVVYHVFVPFIIQMSIEIVFTT